MSHQNPKTDPVYQNSKRETQWILFIWALFAIWVVGISGWLGYKTDPEAPVKVVMGFPNWVFWGIAVPWLGANIAICTFAIKFMKDDPLGDDSENHSSNG